MLGLLTSFLPSLWGCHCSSSHFLLAAHSLHEKAQACLQVFVPLIMLQGFLPSHIGFFLQALNEATCVSSGRLASIIPVLHWESPRISTVSEGCSSPRPTCLEKSVFLGSHTSYSSNKMMCGRHQLM